MTRLENRDDGHAARPACAAAIFRTSENEAARALLGALVENEQKNLLQDANMDVFKHLASPISCQNPPL